MAEVSTLISEVGKLSDEEQVKFLVDYVSTKNVLWLSQATKALQEKFGVTAAVAMAPAGGGAAGGGAATAEKPKEETKASFDVVLKGAGAQKIQIVKLVRQYNPTLGLKEAKDLVDQVEKGAKTIKEGVPKEEAEKIAKAFKDAGADVELA